MYDLPINALRALIAVYETGGVRPAARHLKVAHSSISRHLKELEKWLGVPLFEPKAGSRTLDFSPQGEALGRAGLESFKTLADVVHAIRETPRRNAVLVSTTSSFAALWLLPRLPAFHEAYPWIELSVVVEQKVVDPTQQGADVAIRMGRGPWPGLDCEALMDDALYPVMSRALWEASGQPDSPEDLAGLTLIHDRDPATPWSLWLAEHGAANVDPRQGPRFASSDLVLLAAAQGLGVGLARGRLAANQLAGGGLIRPFGDRHVVLNDAYWIVRSAPAPDRGAVGPVVSWLKAQAASQSVALAPESA